MEQKKIKQLRTLMIHNSYTKYELAEMLNVTTKDIESELRVRAMEQRHQKKIRREEIKNGVRMYQHETDVNTRYTAKQTFTRMHWKSNGFSNSEIDMLTCKYRLSDGLPRITTQ